MVEPNMSRYAIDDCYGIFNIVSLHSSFTAPIYGFSVGFEYAFMHLPKVYDNKLFYIYKFNRLLGHLCLNLSAICCYLKTVGPL